MDFGFTVRILREGSTFVAHVPELDVSSCGDTEADARRKLMQHQDWRGAEPDMSGAAPQP